MAYKPIDSVQPNAELAQSAAQYARLYQDQYYKHLRYCWILWIGVALIVIIFICFRISRIHSAFFTRAIGSTFECRRIWKWQLQYSRIQVLLIAMFTLYISMVSVLDIPYGKGNSYVSKHHGSYIQTATSLQFIANRTGYLAFASMPLIFLLVTRYSILSWLTGVSYTNLHVLHVWVGWSVFVLSWVHTLLWTIEMVLHYRREGGFWQTRWQKRYWLAGFFASLFMTWIVLHSLAVVRRYTGYEFFRITHNLGSVLLLIGCWVHWPEESRWIIACIAVYYFDRMFRWTRIVIHCLRVRGASTLSGTVFTDEDDCNVAIVNIENPGLRRWSAGDHVYIYCLSLGEWEPHPFSVANTSTSHRSLKLIVRQRSGMTRELVDRLMSDKVPLRIVVDGPYGKLQQGAFSDKPLLLFAGGTGIAYPLSILWSLSAEYERPVRLIWFVRRNGMIVETIESLYLTNVDNFEWIKQDWAALQERLPRLELEIRVTRETFNPCRLDSSVRLMGMSSADEVASVKAGHESYSLEADLACFIRQHAALACNVIGCGPGTMTRDLVRTVETLRDSTTIQISLYLETYSM